MMAQPKYTSSVTPTWCPGCGNFGIYTALPKALTECGIEPKDTVIVTDVGCAGNSADFYSTYVFHALHGRALPPAVGIKLANHKLTVFAVIGDGGLFGEGTTHFMNLMRGNHDIVVLHHNNYRYSLTTGQYAPTTPKGTKTPSTPEGVIEEAINPVELALSCRPSFVARGYALNIPHLTDLLIKAIKHTGFAFIDILQPCVTFNKDQTLEWYQKMVKPFAGPLTLEQAKIRAVAKDSLPIGLYYQENRSAYHQEVSSLKETTLVNKDISKIRITKIIDLYK